MDIPINVHVDCADGACGTSTAIVLNPATDQVTAIVVQEPGLLGVDRLVPIELISGSTPQHIQLRCTQDEFAGLTNFTYAAYVSIPPTLSPYQGAGPLFYPSLGLSEPNVTITRHAISRDELAVKHGMRVDATDGRVGRVDELLIDAEHDRVTHLVMREGHLWGAKEVTIPLSQIARIDEAGIHLKLSKHDIALLPTMPVTQRS